MKLFETYQLKNMTLRNRLVLPPMCMYSAADDGLCTDFHFSHYTARAAGGVGLIIMEATAITPNGRISANDLGLWNDHQIEGLRRIVDACHGYGSKMALQLGHAGRKCGVANETIVAPSAIRFDENSRVPHELSLDEITTIVQQFRDAAARAEQAGFDAIEIHAAHGYLISEFLSPLTNQRTDICGTSGVKFLHDVLCAVREVWPAEKPILVRVSAEDYLPEGMHPEQMAQIIKQVQPLFDLLHVSTGGVAPASIHTYPGYQINACAYLKKACDMPVIAVGLLSQPELIEEILNSERADLVALGRELLRNPYWALHVAHTHAQNIPYPEQYSRAFR